MRYAKAVHKLSMSIGKNLAESLGVKSENIGIENWPCQFRINKYFTSDSIGSPGVLMHTDPGFLTILQDDEEVVGLEVMDQSGEFIPVDPWPGTLLVNFGDMATRVRGPFDPPMVLFLFSLIDIEIMVFDGSNLKVWSNGRLCNVKHRVQCKEAKLRVSIASFLLGPKETVEPPKELVDDDHPRLYVATTYEDYRKMRFSTKLQAGEALALLHTP
ncbi:hypothetical protein R6Q57_005663 [Mikania cordata]